MPYGNRNHYYKECPICLIKFKLAYWELKTKKTCSFECSKKYKACIPISLETRQKISYLKKGKFLKENSSQWKGGNASYESIHEWVRKNFDIPKACEDCKKEVRLDAANLSGKYIRQREDWRFLCRKCHCKLDGKNSNYFRTLRINQIKNKII